VNSVPKFLSMPGSVDHGESTDEELKSQFEDFKKKGIDVLMYNGGQEPEVYARVGKRV